MIVAAEKTLSVVLYPKAGLSFFFNRCAKWSRSYAYGFRKEAECHVGFYITEL